MASLLKLSKIYDNQLWLSIPKNIKQEAWIQSQSQQSNAVAKTNAYYNNIALHTLKPEIEAWLEDDYRDGQFPITVFKNSCLPTIWEFLNGTVIEVKGNRIVLITETTETDELCICQEWIDILSWQGDYFVAVQINPEDDWVRVRGFIDYSLLNRLKDKKGIYDKQERAYYIPNKYLTDIENIGDLVDDLQPITREEFAPIPSPELTPELLQNLGDRYLYYPRLAIDFDQWLELLVSDRTREQLFEKRMNEVATVTEPVSNSPVTVTTSPSEQDKVSTLEWIKQALTAITNMIVEPLTENELVPSLMVTQPILGYEGSKIINLGSKPNEEIKLTVILEPCDESNLINVLIDICSNQENQKLPTNLKLVALDQKEDELMSVTSESEDNNISLEFDRLFKEPFTIKLSLNQWIFMETFK